MTVYIATLNQEAVKKLVKGFVSLYIEAAINEASSQEVFFAMCKSAIDEAKKYCEEIGIEWSDDFVEFEDVRKSLGLGEFSGN